MQHKNDSVLEAKKAPAEDIEFDGVDPDVVKDRRAQEPFASRTVMLSACVSRTRVEINIRDQGDGFDTSIVPSSVAGATIDMQHGRGLLMMATHMDEVHFNERGNEVRMVKYTRRKK